MDKISRTSLHLMVIILLRAAEYDITYDSVFDEDTNFENEVYGDLRHFCTVFHNEYDPHSETIQALREILREELLMTSDYLDRVSADDLLAFVKEVSEHTEDDPNHLYLFIQHMIGEPISF